MDLLSILHLVFDKPVPLAGDTGVGAINPELLFEIEFLI
jgi:hypothetical protein